MADVPAHINLDTDAVVRAVIKTLRLDAETIRAEVAEGIARAIERAAGIRCPECGGTPTDRVGPKFWCINHHMWNGWMRSTTEAAAIARNYTATATGTPTSDAPAHRLEHQ